MTSRFAALAVGDGDSFLLRTPDSNGRECSVLFDVGRSAPSLIRALRRQDASLTHLDIVVISHRDRDHSGALAKFVEQWTSKGGSIGELWLPAFLDLHLVCSRKWSIFSRIEEGAKVLADHAMARLGNEVGRDRGEVSDEALTAAILSAIPDLIRDGDRPELDDGEATRRSEKDAPAVAHSEIMGTQEPFDDIRWWILENECRHRVRGVHRRRSPEARNSLKERKRFPSIKDALHLGALQQLQWQAETMGVLTRVAPVTVRWFDVTPVRDLRRSPSGGREGLLEPVNAIELALTSQLSKTNPALYVAYLYLSPANLNCLVFERPETTEEPAVLFCGDSPLAFDVNGAQAQRPLHTPERAPIITAPHHGSNSNQAAYGIIENWLPKNVTPIFVRNGGKHVRIGDDWLDQACRYCTFCVLPRGPDQRSEFATTSASGERQLPPALGSVCVCPPPYS